MSRTAWHCGNRVGDSTKPWKGDLLPLLLINCFRFPSQAADVPQVRLRLDGGGSSPPPEEPPPACVPGPAPSALWPRLGCFQLSHSSFACLRVLRHAGLPTAALLLDENKRRRQQSQYHQKKHNDGHYFFHRASLAFMVYEPG